MHKRFLHTVGALALAASATVHAQGMTPIKFQLDWRFEALPRCSWCPPPRAISRTPSSTWP